MFKVCTFPTVFYQHSPPGRFRIRSEVALPGSAPNPPGGTILVQETYGNIALTQSSLGKIFYSIFVT